MKYFAFRKIAPFIQKYPYGILTAGFLIVYGFSLTFLYVEGDDASTIAYHALGRNPEIQTPYSAYHGMMDRLLSIFPAQETVLRVVSIILAAISAISFTILSLKLVSLWIPQMSKRYFPVFIILIPVFIPELLFLGLIYMPSTWAMTLLLLSHLWTRKTFQNQILNPWRLLSGALLFGLGASFRWDVAVYGIVIFLDCLFIIWPDSSRRVSRLLVLMAWSVGSILAIFVFIYLSGYSPQDIYEIIRWAKSYVGAKSFDFFKSGAVAISLFTPAVLLCFGAGLVQVIYNRRWDLLLLGIAGFLPKLYLGISFLPKGLIMAFPGLMLILALGFNFINEINRKKLLLNPIQWILILVLALPWLIGIKVYNLSSSRGPGFEISYKFNKADPNDISNENSLSKYVPGFFAGFAIPTPEGSRPLWGYAYVLLGGEWRHLVRQLHEERERVIDISVNEALPILQNNEYKILLTSLLKDHYKEKFPMKTYEFFKHRSFIAQVPNGQNNPSEVDIYILKNNTLFDARYLAASLEIIGKKKFICWFLESSDLTRLKSIYPQSVTILGPCSARVNLEGIY